MKARPPARVFDICWYWALRSLSRSALLKKVRSQYSGWWRSANPPSRSERMKLRVMEACL